MTNSPAFWIGYIVLIFAFMYFIAIRPQQKEKKKMQELMASIAVGDIRPLKIRDVMTPNPTTIQPQALAAEAAKILNSTLRNQLLVVDDSDRLIGALHIHDLMTAKVI